MNAYLDVVGDSGNAIGGTVVETPRPGAMASARLAIDLLADAAALLDYAHRSSGTIYTGAAVVALSRARAAVHAVVTEYDRADARARLTP